MHIGDRELDEAALTLAGQLEHDVVGHDAAVIIGALCWLLAGLLRQAAREKGIALSAAIEIVTRQIWLFASTLEQLDTLRTEARH